MLAFSSTRMPPSFAFADKACLRASARTFFGRSIPWLRGVGPNARPPPRKRLTRAEPWRADPVPFWRYIFLPVRLISLRFLTSWVPRCRFASCQRTQRCRISARGSRPKIASGRSIVPAWPPSRVMILSSTSGALLLDRLSRFGGFYLVAARSRLTLRQTEFARLGNTVGQLLFHCVPQGDPAALVPGNGALNQNQPTLDVGLHDFEVQRGDALDAHMAGHLFVLERLAGILATAGRPMRAMRDGH